ncbi:hypothetical protein KFK09_014693 [Dendrobium nobile]|uniref:Uncharacterized protein n=1 Tax=Dendrobium nobile TaxID=94219 RepID=A0A8T3B3U4_DENNO|nr:hypothetical protein KFK09_014693 [Dendrobium nobile]
MCWLANLSRSVHDHLLIFHGCKRKKEAAVEYGLNLDVRMPGVDFCFSLYVSDTLYP